MGSVLLGPQPVKILTSIMAATTADLREAAREEQKLDVDILEWRADFFESRDLNSFIAAALELKQLAEKPVLWTLRSSAEGGHGPIGDEYLALVRGMAQSGLLEAVDMELSRGITAEDVALAHSCGTAVIVSCHNFSATPAFSEMQKTFENMAATGADVLKLAVMPLSPEDVLSLMQATLWARRTFDKPVISMSMGPWGALTRVAGALFGSSATFASTFAPSAPGQYDVATARRLMKEL